ncbi:MAG: stage IV sporulation protein A [Lachnospiraceae bacterium]|jgi:stage IV sporulation protein A|nr:stage IV sporulation protein A [Lachnospiraceae bacterium]
MDNFHVYKDMEARTKGEIYIGVVGPVRTGKSTFIKRFMELLVIPAMEDENSRNLSRDELPQSAAGKTIMTTEPKFIPKEAAKIQLDDGISVKVRLIDCVGFMVDGAAGHIENDTERMVKTPWYDTEIPFTKAAEIGTRKVICDHSTIGVVITSDGSFGDLRRPSYINAEQTAIEELKALHKPFIVLLNSMRPYSDETAELARSMEEEYGVSVMPVNCEQLKKEDIYHILEKVLKEFPVVRLDFVIPKWLEILPSTHPMKAQVIEVAKQVLGQVGQMKDVSKGVEDIHTDSMKEIRLDRMNMADGCITMNVVMDDGCYYQILSDFTGLPIEGEYQLMQTLESLARMQKEYIKVQDALSQVRLKGYGAVRPERSEILLDDPQVIRHGNKYGVKIKAEAPSIHMIKAQIQTEIAPIVGSEQQAQDLISYIKESSRENPEGIWDANIFGKSIEQIVGDGIHAKISQLTDESQMKLQDTMQKIINDSNGGMICIII